VVTCTAEDSAGNRAEETFTITVEPPREEEQQAREEPPANNTEA
jgi:hypothetical protein